MSIPMLWRITCLEADYPGLWLRWLKCQCVTVGYPPLWKFLMEGGETKPDWIKARKALTEIQPGDFVVASLPGRRIGRLGEVTSNKTANDQWEPLIPRSRDEPEGQMGRRILVRWDLESAPDDLDLVVQVPDDFKIGWRGTLNRVHGKSVEEFQELMADPANWVGLHGRFGYEQALSDYIALYPHRLEDGLLPHPSKKIRERVFQDRSRLDVLLLDKDDKPVIVECKQNSPTVADITQLRRYIKRLKAETGGQARGILVHGGARKVHKEVWHEAEKPPRVEVIQYKLDVDFATSC